jgi:hypothetical protein
MPWSVLDSNAYANISPLATRLLFDLARQYSKYNNGSLLLTLKHLKTRGWKSADLVNKAKKELIANGLIYETVKGHRPNKASWYAITWQTLDVSNKYDYDLAGGFRRGAYNSPPITKSASVRPLGGAKGGAIAPVGGSNRVRLKPPCGAMAIESKPLLAPPAGIHLDIPSPVEAAGRRVTIASNRDRSNKTTETDEQRPRVRIRKN